MSEIFESKWGETKTALTEGLDGNKKKVMNVILENTKRYLSEASYCRCYIAQVTLLL